MVEILITTYNRKHFLELAIPSVLAQDYKKFILTIVVSGSNDGTLEYVRELEHTDSRIRVIYFEKNLGVVGNTERATRHTTERYIVMFHDDDIMETDMLSMYMQNLESHCVLYHSATTLIDDKGNLLKPQPSSVAKYIERGKYAELIATRRKSADIFMPTVMIDTQLLISNNKWPLKLNKRLSMLVDMGIWLQLNKYGSFKYFDEALLRYRLHQNSGTTYFSLRIREMLLNRYIILHELLANVDNRVVKVMVLIYVSKSILYDIKNWVIGAWRNSVS